LSKNTVFRGATQWRTASGASLPSMDVVPDRGHEGGCAACGRRQVTPLLRYAGIKSDKQRLRRDTEYFPNSLNPSLDRIKKLL